ncbi:MAG: tape measure protein, partial [Hyphomicrobiaceae bacterium]|nr:tape measure protein [Hyphomicrobiaceae bacterium]
MATDEERLIVRLEATQARFEKQLAAASRSADRRARQIESRFMAMNKHIERGAANVGRQFVAAFAATASLRGAQQLIDASTRITNALKVSGLEGAKLESVYERLFSSAMKNAAPVESLVELYSRASLVQKELGVSTEELLGFTDKVALALRVSGKSAQESSGALLQLSQALGSGVVRAEEFNSILEGALPIAQAAAAGLEEAGGSVAKLRQLVVDGKVSSEAFFRAFEAGSVILQDKVAGATLTVDQGLTNVQNALVNAVRKFDDATGASKTMADSLTKAADAIRA